MVPPILSTGKLVWIFEGEANIVTRLQRSRRRIKTFEFRYAKEYSRFAKGRPYAEKNLSPREPMILDARHRYALSVAKGGTAAVPSVRQQQERSYSISSRNGRMRTSSSTLAAEKRDAR